MSLLASLSTDDSIQNETDSVGGVSLLDSGLYNSTVQTAYIGKSAGGAISLVCVFKTDTGKDIRQTFWMTSGTSKGGKNYYEKDGEKRYLPGFLAANSLALLATGKEISALDTETKVVKAYNKDAKGEVPTKVEMLMELLGKEITVGLIKQTVDKTTQTDAGYVSTGETREENEVDKLFRAGDGMTTAEIRASATTADFIKTWETKWKGITKNKAKGVAASGTAGAPKAAPATTNKKPSASLFG